MNGLMTLLFLCLNSLPSNSIHCCRYSRNQNDPKYLSCDTPGNYEWCFMCGSQTCNIFKLPFMAYDLNGVNFTGIAKAWPHEGCRKYEHAISPVLPAFLTGEICYCNHGDYCNQDFLPREILNQALKDTVDLATGRGIPSFGQSVVESPDILTFTYGAGAQRVPAAGRSDVRGGLRPVQPNPGSERRNGASAPVFKNETRMMVFFVVWGMAAIFASLCCVVCQQTACCCSNL